MDTEFTHTPANASSADYQNHSSLVLIPPDQTTQYTTEKHTTDYNVERMRSRPSIEFQVDVLAENNVRV